MTESNDVNLNSFLGDSSYHEIWECGQEFGDLPDAGGLIDEPVAVAVQDHLLQVLQVRVVDQGAEISPVGGRNCGGREEEEEGEGEREKM